MIFIYILFPYFLLQRSIPTPFFKFIIFQIILVMFTLSQLQRNAHHISKSYTVANVWRLAGPILEASSAKISTSHRYNYAWLDVLVSYV